MKNPPHCDTAPWENPVETPGTVRGETNGVGVELTADDAKQAVELVFTFNSFPELWTPTNNCCGGGTAP